MANLGVRGMVKFVILLIIPFLFLCFSALKSTTHPYILDYDTLRFKKPVIPADNPLTIEGVALGRLLFYDPLLSGNNTQSCGSCHKQEYSFSDGGAKYSLGIKGKPGKKNTMTLVNLVWQQDYFWDGRATSLEDVMKFPITDSLEMSQDTTKLVVELQAHPHYPEYFKTAFGTNKITFNLISKALAQFLRTIIIKGYSAEFLEIEKLMRKDKTGLENQKSLAGMYYRTTNTCGRCHPGEGMGQTAFADNGITLNDTTGRYAVTHNRDDISKFKIPSLINIKYSAPYMHDGRFTNLGQIAIHYKENLLKLNEKNTYILARKINSDLTQYDMDNIEAFFDLFTDTTILRSKKYSDPFNSESFNWDDYPNFK
jgi:cytochrome c peroxidase